MSEVTFSQVWKMAYEAAQSTGKISWIRRESSKPGTEYVARTMHPSFMGVVPKKHDPERDGQPNSMTLLVNELSGQMDSMHDDFERVLGVAPDRKRDDK